MPKNRHSSRDAKVQPSEVNEYDRPLVSYTGQPHGTGPKGESIYGHSTQNDDSLPLASSKNRPAALKLNPTTAATPGQQQHPQQQQQQQQQQSQINRHTCSLRSQPPPHHHHQPQQQHQDSLQSKKHRRHYCPKHDPNNQVPIASSGSSSSSRERSRSRSKSKSPGEGEYLNNQTRPPYLLKSDKAAGENASKASPQQVAAVGAGTTGTRPGLNNTPTSTNRQPARVPVTNREEAKPSGKVVEETTKRTPNQKAKEDSKSSSSTTQPVSSSKKKPPSEVTSIPQTNMSIGLLVFCCFNPILGGLAIYLSLTAAKAYRDGNNSRGASRAHWSIIMSLFGIMITMVIVSSLVVYIAVAKHYHNQKFNTLSRSTSLGF